MKTMEFCWKNATRNLLGFIIASALIGCATTDAPPEIITVKDLPAPAFAELKAYPTSDVATLRPSYQTHVCVGCKPKVALDSSNVIWIMLEKETPWEPSEEVHDKTYVEQLGEKHFDFAKYQLRGDLGRLDAFVFMAKENPNARIEIVGHTDSIGPAAFNMRLGQKRADMVKAYLVSKGVEKNIITTSSRGEKEPVFSNKTAEDRRLNRRAAMTLTINVK